MRKSFTLFAFLTSFISFSQTELSAPPQNTASGMSPDWTILPTRAGDTCGVYFNNYVGLGKTSEVGYEPLRTGSGADFTPYAGRAQRFHAPQEIEISGVQFYSFHTNEEVDSIMVITLLLDYEPDGDTAGVELARDTVWVSHTEFTPLLPSLEVNSYFDSPVIVDEDYMVGYYTPTDDSLKIITSSAAAGDGDGEGVSFAYYDNPAAPAFTGWYSTLPTFGPSYDLDYLINPLVRYKLHDGFTIINDSVCPAVPDGICVNYEQKPVFSDRHYNSLYETPTSKTYWIWGDGEESTAVLDECHIYAESGTYEITLIDSITRYDYFDNTCAAETTEEAFILDSIDAVITSSTSAGLTADFVGEAVEADSVFWNFGDGSEGSDELEPSHMYDAIGDYEVWFYAYGPCNTDSAMVTITISDVGIVELENTIKIYPNPANEFVSINGLPSGTTITLFNILGEVVTSTTSSKVNHQLATENLAPGTYFIQFNNGTANTTKKLVIKH